MKKASSCCAVWSDPGCHRGKCTPWKITTSCPSRCRSRRRSGSRSARTVNRRATVVDQAMRRVGLLAAAITGRYRRGDDKRWRVIEQTAVISAKISSSSRHPRHSASTTTGMRPTGNQRLFQSLLRSWCRRRILSKFGCPWAAQGLRQTDSRVDRYGDHHAGAALCGAEPAWADPAVYQRSAAAPAVAVTG